MRSRRRGRRSRHPKDEDAYPAPRREDSHTGFWIGIGGLVVAVASLAWAVYTTRDAQDARPAPATQVMMMDNVPSPFVVVYSANGTCQPSVVSLRADAYRCFEKGRSKNALVADPCFVDGSFPKRPAVVCPRNPWSGDFNRLILTKPLPQTDPGRIAPDLTKVPPWALRLQDGRVCGSEAGFTGVVANLRINYVCAMPGLWSRPVQMTGSGDGYSYAAGEPDRSRAAWTVLVADSWHGSWHTAAIASAYF